MVRIQQENIKELQNKMRKETITRWAIARKNANTGKNEYWCPKSKIWRGLQYAHLYTRWQFAQSTLDTTKAALGKCEIVSVEVTRQYSLVSRQTNDVRDSTEKTITLETKE